MCHNKPLSNNTGYLRAHSMLYSLSRVAGPSQRPRVHEVHWASITGSWTCVSPGQYDVVSMGVIAAAFPILERNGPCISCPNYRQPLPVLTWWAKRTQFAFLEGVCRSIWSSIWWSTTLARCNRLNCYILCHINTHYYVLFSSYTWGFKFKLDFTAEGDQGILEVHRLDAIGHQWPHMSSIVFTVICVIGTGTDSLARTAPGCSYVTAAWDFCLSCISVSGGLWG